MRNYRLAVGIVSLIGVGGLGAAAPSLARVGAVRLEEEHWRHPHMHHALMSLRDARKELEDAEEVFHGRRAAALDHVDAAIQHVRDGLREQRDDATVPSTDHAPIRLREERFPHLHNAFEHLKAARTELEAADQVFGGHRDEALEHTKKAIHQVEDAMR